MPFTLTEACARARAVARESLTVHAELIDTTARWPVENLAALQQVGLAGLTVPTAAGGHGLGLEAVGRVCEVLGEACASTAISFGMHLVGAAVIAAKANPEQQSRYLEPIARGEHLTTLALSEPGTGAHFYLPEARLVRDGDGFRITGTKTFVTNGGNADSYVMSATGAAESAEAGEFSCVVVDKGAPGLSWSGTWSGWGMRGNSALTASLEGVPVSQRALLGEEGDQIWYVFNVVAPFFIMAMAGTYVGVASASLEEARKHLADRTHTHSGRSLAHSPIIQHRVGAMWAQVQRTRSLLYDAARLSEQGDPQALLALCSAKAEVAEAAEQVTGEAMTLMGGRGYADGHRIHRLYRDARAAHVMSPTTDLLRTWTGRAFLGLPILGE